MALTLPSLIFFAEEAFLCQKDYLQAMLICLEAVEQNKPAILAEVNPNLVSVLTLKNVSAFENELKLTRKKDFIKYMSGNSFYFHGDLPIYITLYLTTLVRHLPLILLLLSILDSQKGFQSPNECTYRCHQIAMKDKFVPEDFKLMSGLAYLPNRQTISHDYYKASFKLCPFLIL